MTLLRDHDLAHAVDHASHTDDRLTAMRPGRHAGLRRAARSREPSLHLWCGLLTFGTAPVFVQAITRAGSPFVPTVPVARRQTGIVHAFLARSGAAPAGTEAS
jgi:hypothetical protein